MLMEYGVEFVCADFPTANRLTIHIIAAVAEHEAVMISSRTKAGLLAAKHRGVKLGKSMNQEKAIKGHVTQSLVANRNAAKVRSTVNGLVAAGISLRKIAGELNTMAVPTPRGSQWTAQAVKNALARA